MWEEQQEKHDAWARWMRRKKTIYQLSKLTIEGIKLVRCGQEPINSIGKRIKPRQDAGIRHAEMGSKDMM